MKISILLPYKENFSPEYPGAVSIFLNSVVRKSKYNSKITVFGYTSFKKTYPNIRYKNIEISQKILGLGSQTSKYISNFISLENKNKSHIIEVHNRPIYIKLLENIDNKKILYFHNDPLTMNGSKSIIEREYLLDKCDRIIFNSNWSKNRFLTELDSIYIKSEKLLVVCQSANKQKVDINKKKTNYYICW